MLIRLLLFCLFALQALACEPPADYVPIAERAPKALLFKVHGCGQPVRYLFGTFHSDSTQLQPIIEHLTPYLAKSQRLWVEIVSSRETLIKTQQFLLVPPESPPLSERVDEALYEGITSKIVPLLSIQASAVERYQPWALALLAQYPPPENDGIILDVKLQHLAARKAVVIAGLEDIEQQLKLFHQMPASLRLDFVRNAIETADEIRPTIAQLKKHYLARDIWAIERLSREQFDEMTQRQPELAVYLEQTLIDARNKAMAQTILERTDHIPFIAVGALHLPGKTGLFRQLETAGLQISPIKQ